MLEILSIEGWHFIPIHGAEPLDSGRVSSGFLTKSGVSEDPPPHPSQLQAALVTVGSLVPCVSLLPL